MLQAAVCRGGASYSKAAGTPLNNPTNLLLRKPRPKRCGTPTHRYTTQKKSYLISCMHPLRVRTSRSPAGVGATAAMDLSTDAGGRAEDHRRPPLPPRASNEKKRREGVSALLAMTIAPSEPTAEHTQNWAPLVQRKEMRLPEAMECVPPLAGRAYQRRRSRHRSRPLRDAPAVCTWAMICSTTIGDHFEARPLL